ncbi:MAG: helix-turn-helix transcriptional regulator [Candidatus Poribacteria bacterium]|nr:helix-turn-helix transcriptional regulator [Candidatus Poribacteria bacterium]
MVPIGENILKLLEKSDMDAPTLSRYAHVGPRRLQRILNQERLPSVSEIERIAAALGVSPSVLVETDDPPNVAKEIDPQLVELLEKPKLAAALWYLSELPTEDRYAVFNVIERFAAMA